MLSLITRIFITVLLVTPLTGFTKNTTLNYFDQKYWSGFDWVNAEKSPLWNEAGYKIEPQEFSTSPVLYKRVKIIDIEGQPFYSSLMKLNKGEYPFQSLISFQKTQNDSCKSMNQKLTKAFGASSEMLDNSRYYIKDIGAFEYDWQWDVGNTRVTLSCHSRGKQPDMNQVVIVAYQHLDNDSRIEKPIHLTCSQRARFLNSEWMEADPLGITVLPHKKIITNTDRLIISPITFLNDKLIKFTFKSDDLEMTFDINRVDGSLTGTEITASDNAVHTEGKCEVIDPTKRKF